MCWTTSPIPAVLNGCVVDTVGLDDGHDDAPLDPRADRLDGVTCVLARCDQALDRGPYYMLPTGTTQGQLQGHCTKPTFLPTCTGIGVVRLCSGIHRATAPLLPLEVSLAW